MQKSKDFNIDGVFLGLGTNLGNRHGNLEKCLLLITNHIGRIIKKSSIHETKAWGNTNQADFLNMVIKVDTDLSPQQLLKECMSIEQLIGRIRKEKWGPRIIDIDILYYKNLVIDEINLKIPHPLIQERDFVLVPLQEVI